MNVLITGGGGFIGSHLVESQLRQGNQVRTIDLHFESLSHLAECTSLEIVQADLTDKSILASLVDGIDIVYHLASAHLDISQSEAHYKRVNIDATVNLLQAAHRAGVRRFLHCSSVGVIGDVQVPLADEEEICRPTNIYERTKLAGEQAVLSYYQQTGCPVVIVRPAWVYGPRCPRTQKLLRSIAKKRFFLFGKGNNLRHPLYYLDFLDGFERAAMVDGIEGQVYILAGEKPVKTRDLVDTAAECLQVSVPRFSIPVGLGLLGGYIFQAGFGLVGRQPPFSARTLDFFTKNNAYSTEKARKDIGFTPKFDLPTGFAETIQWMYVNKQFS